jgi:hypothetical protein
MSVDRKIAELVMGEAEPKTRVMHLSPMSRSLVGTVSPGGNWILRGTYASNVLLSIADTYWEPMPFSTDIDHAMRAMDEYLSGVDPEKPGTPRREWLWLTLNYDGAPYMQDEPWSAALVDDEWHSMVGVDGRTIADAIGNLLVALKEEA